MTRKVLLGLGDGRGRWLMNDDCIYARLQSTGLSASHVIPFCAFRVEQTLGHPQDGPLHHIQSSGRSPPSWQGPTAYIVGSAGRGRRQKVTDFQVKVCLLVGRFEGLLSKSLKTKVCLNLVKLEITLLRDVIFLGGVQIFPPKIKISLPQANWLHIKYCWFRVCPATQRPSTWSDLITFFRDYPLWIYSRSDHW